MTNAHQGSSLDEFLREEEIYEQASSAAMARVIAWQLTRLINEHRLTKQAMAERMGTSRSQLDRLLNLTNGGVTQGIPFRAAQAVEKDLHLELVQHNC